MSPEQAAVNALAGLMNVLTQTEGWDAYVRELGDMEMRTLGGMIHEEKERFDYNKGFIMGLRWAASLPAQLKNRAKS